MPREHRLKRAHEWTVSSLDKGFNAASLNLRQERPLVKPPDKSRCDNLSGKSDCQAKKILALGRFAQPVSLHACPIDKYILLEPRRQEETLAYETRRHERKDTQQPNP